MRNRIAVLTLMFILSGLFQKVYAVPAAAGEFVIFPVYSGNMVIDEILIGTEKRLIETLREAGRLVPYEYNFRKMALEKSVGDGRDSFYRNAAIKLKAGVYAVVTAGTGDGGYYVNIKLVSLAERYEVYNRDITVRGRIPGNLSLKAAREVALFLSGIPLTCEVLEIYQDGTAMIDAGQWHGLRPGGYDSDAGRVTIENISRYRSYVRATGLRKGMVLKIDQRPDLDYYLKEINKEIRRSTSRHFGTDAVFDKREGSVKGFIQGTCVINQGASFCLPGYGSFLSMEYMGIEKGKPDYPSIFLTASLTAVHLGLVPYMTDFKANFFPWVDDKERSGREERLNWFLWGTLPLTFTASFYSQLAYNYNELRLLPPMFTDHDFSAAAISVFVPGGGMFYKGYRWTGWGLYTGELSLAGYAVYTEDKRNRAVAVGSLVFIRCVEIISSYFISPSYDYFNQEVADSGNVDLNAGFNIGESGEKEVRASLVLRY